MRLTTHLCVVAGLRMSGAVPALALHTFMVWALTTSPFIYIGTALLFAIFVESISVDVEE
jgi:hypothetical protein